MRPIIRIEGVTKTFGSKVVAIQDVSLSINEGEFVTLLGPSGCGKTTILRMVAGFEMPDCGRIILGDEDVTDVPPYRRPLNMVFQDFALFPHMTIKQNINYGLKVKGIPKAQAKKAVEDVLKMVELVSESDRRPNELSGGQRQRAALARALVHKPKVLLLDEPLSSLDANLRAQLRVELKHLHEKLGLTFLMVTHDQTEALVMADRVVLMQDGRIAQDGTPEQIYDHPASIYVANFIGATNLFHGRVVANNGRDFTISSGGQELIARPSPAVSGIGEDVAVCVRPEKARIVSPGTDSTNLNTMTVMVDELLYHGSSVRVQFRLKSDELFLVDVPLATASDRDRLPNTGEQIIVGFAPGNTTIFPWEERR
jgi:putative spermidine/putrescine transport system ATP-binding protein/spermidine/putrescine transport system ATP-binding protein